MGKTSDGATDQWRESAAFDVTVADYRRAFALAIADAPDEGPSPRALLRGLGGLCLAFVIMGVIGVAVPAAFTWLCSGSPAATLYYAANAAWTLVPSMAAIGLLLGLLHVWNQITTRRHFPMVRAEWKRPTRMRVRWNDTALVRMGMQGFGSFAWTGLHAWLDTPEALVVFTAMFDPVPIPHAALAPGDLDDLRARLARAEVPAKWSALSPRQQGLRRVFR